MTLMKKAVLLLVVLVGLVFSQSQFTPQAWAQNKASAQETTNQQKPNFAVDLETTYNVLPSGNTKVSHHFQIRNLNPTLFIKQYGLKLSSTKIDNPVARSKNNEEISTSVVTNNNQTSIGITFPDQVVGQNKVRDFTITYTDPDIASINGQILEVSIPRQASIEEFTSNIIKIYTPLAFGSPSKSKPNAFKFSLTPDKKNFETIFTDLKGESVFLIFGDQQTFDLELQYALENPTNQKKITQIAFPPDTPYQRVNYRLLEPIPSELHTDIDGNWIATYDLDPNSATTVKANLQVQLTLEPDSTIPFMQPDESLVATQKYWPVDNANIIKLATGLPDIKSTYDYVVNTLKYDFGKNLSSNSDPNAEIARLGADKILKTPEKALCQEFSDLFISLARAKKIPARRVAGYAHTQNNVLRPLSFAEDILHAWPEYFDQEKNLWIPVDPTWENTSGGVDYFNQFDLNHIVFVINGTSSTLPFPAGSYKKDGDNSQDVKVKFTDQFLISEPDFEITAQSKNIFGLSLPSTNKLFIFNKTGQAHYNLDLKFVVAEEVEEKVDKITLEPTSPYLLKSILPFEKKEIKIKAYRKGLFWPKKENLTVQYETKAVTVPITISPEFIKPFANPYLILAVGSSLTTLALGAGSLLVLWKRWHGSLRWQSKKTKK